ncbi:MAG: putative flagella basal body P-ring formation protein flgA [Microvirga sp.]|jgi:flagella basal body P-ring formation protein FlgA|nr:putative flagella basal body P-ring formation protein flgA [Microvirga sp.]
MRYELLLLPILGCCAATVANAEQTAVSMPPSVAPVCNETSSGVAETVADISLRLQEGSGVRYEKLELEPMGQLPLVRHPAVAAKGAWPRSRVALQLSWTDCASGLQRSELVWFKARVYREIWVYRRDARAEDPVSQAEPRKELVDIAALQLREAELARSVEGTFLACNVHEGAPVLSRQLTPMLYVRRNDPVSVLVEGRGLRLRLAGTALRGGTRGAVVPVQVRGAAETVQAVVVAGGEVHVGL